MKVEVWYAVDEDGGQYLFTKNQRDMLNLIQIIGLT